MKTEKLKYVPQWGKKLMERVEQAGIYSVSTDSLGEIEELYYVGKKRIQYLQFFLNKYNPDKIVEQNEHFIVQRTADNTFDIFFNDIKTGDSKLEVARVVVNGEKEARRRVKGQLIFRTKHDKLYRLKFEATKKSIRPYGNQILSTSAQKLIWRVIEIALARTGEKMEMVSSRL